MSDPSNLQSVKNFGLKIVWVEFLILDLSLSKTTEFEILNALAKLSHKVELIALRSRNPCIGGTKVRFTIVPLRNIRLITPIMFTIVQALLLPLRIAFSDIDIIITEPGVNIFGLFPSFLLRNLRKTKFVLDIRSPPVEISSRSLSFLERICFDASIFTAKRFFDGMTTITSRMRDEICQRYHIDKDFVGVWPSGVSTAVFSSDNNASPSDFKESLHLAGKFVVLYHGYFASDRGLKETIDAITLLRSSYPDIILFLLGAGSFEKDLKSIVDKRNLNDCVIVHGPVNYFDVPKFIAMSDVGIVPLPDLPKWRAQCPLKLLEYLAMKKPVILTDIPAHRAIVKDEKCGIYIGSTEPQEIAKAIIYAYQNKENLAKWGEKGKEIVKKEYTWEKVAKNLEEYLMKTSRNRLNLRARSN